MFESFGLSIAAEVLVHRGLGFSSQVEMLKAPPTL